MVNWLGLVGCGKIAPGCGGFCGAGAVWTNTVFPGRHCCANEEDEPDVDGLWFGGYCVTLLCVGGSHLATAICIKWPVARWCRGTRGCFITCISFAVVFFCLVWLEKCEQYGCFFIRAGGHGANCSLEISTKLVALLLDHIENARGNLSFIFHCSFVTGFPSFGYKPSDGR
jgi:hypothetical protein